MRYYFLITICILIPTIILTQEFKSISAKAALEKYNKEIKRADEIKNEAEIQYKKELKISLDLAVKTGNKKEVALIESILYGTKDKKNEFEELPDGIIALFYEQEEYKGKTQVVNDIGKFSSSKLELDQVRSLKLKSGYKIIFYLKDDCDENSTTVVIEKNTAKIIPKGISYQVKKNE